MRKLISISLLIFLVACKKEPAAPLPIANFFVDNAACSSPCYVHFYDQSYGAINWDWEFDNSYTSINQHDSCLYQQPGLYDVTLTVWNKDNASDKITKRITVY